jgi:hypothetical protein
VSAGHTIAAIPTVYRGRRYRSRLEARWAAFFDRLGMEHEYEPYDLGKWSPDFLLTKRRRLVEVKPFIDLDDPTLARMHAACVERGSFEADGGAISAILHTIAAPRICVVDGCRFLQLGWASRRSYSPVAGILGWLPTYHGYEAIVCFLRSGGPNEEDIEANRRNPVVPETDATLGLRAWADACNDVQWLASGGR